MACIGSLVIGGNVDDEHDVHGGVVLLLLPNLLARKKVHLSWEDSQVMISSSTVIVAWFFNGFPARDCIPAEQIKLGLRVETILGSTCKE